MKINQSSLNQAAAAELAKARQAEAATQHDKAGAGAAAEPDRADVSDLSGKLLRLLSSDSPGRSSRLERLAAAVRAGAYQVDARTLSHSIVEDALQPEP